MNLIAFDVYTIHPKAFQVFSSHIYVKYEMAGKCNSHTPQKKLIFFFVSNLQMKDHNLNRIIVWTT